MALCGIRVVELAGLAPAPFCGMILSDFGAHVTRIDKVGGQTDMDRLSRGKRSIALDLKHEEGVEVVRTMCTQADVLIEPFRKGVMERLGLGPARLLVDNPMLIYARMTGFGQSGIMADRAGHDINYLALSGILSCLAGKNKPPTPPINMLADFAGGGLMCAFGILVALLERHTSGKGQVVDASMVEGAAYVGTWMYTSQDLPLWGRPTGENTLDGGSHFYRTYRTSDGKYMAVGALEPKFYTQLLDGLGLDPDEVPQFGDADQLSQLLASKFSQHTQMHWCRVFDSRDACVSPVLSMQEAPNHPHNVARKSFVHSPDGKPVPQPAPRLTRTPGVVGRGGIRPHLGEHTAVILKEIGYTKSDIQALIDSGIAKLQSKI